MSTQDFSAVNPTEPPAAAVVRCPAAAPPNSAEWHAQRRLGIGGSEVHNLFPCLDLSDPSDTGSRYGCPRRLSYEKLNVAPDYAYTPQQLRIFERGHILEDHAARRYMQETGKRVFRSNHPRVSKSFPWMRCNIDRRIKIENERRTFLECKSVSEHVFWKYKKEGLILANALQVQHNIACTESDAGVFAVIEAPDYLDAVIENIADESLREKVIAEIAPTLDFFSFPLERDDSLIALLAEKERIFWNLVERGELAPELPDVKDERCTSCNFRKTCRGKAWDEANSRIVKREKGVQYVQIENQTIAQAAADRLIAMNAKNEAEETIAGIDNELKQNLPKDACAVQLAGTGIKIQWDWQKGAKRWDSDALKADAASIGRQIHFAQWVSGEAPELVAKFQKEYPSSPSFMEKYQTQSAPSRPFRFTIPGMKEK